MAETRESPRARTAGSSTDSNQNSMRTDVHAPDAGSTATLTDTDPHLSPMRRRILPSRPRGAARPPDRNCRTAAEPPPSAEPPRPEPQQARDRTRRAVPSHRAANFLAVVRTKIPSTTKSTTAMRRSNAAARTSVNCSR